MDFKDKVRNYARMHANIPRGHGAKEIKCKKCGEMGYGANHLGIASKDICQKCENKLKGR